MKKITNLLLLLIALAFVNTSSAQNYTICAGSNATLSGVNPLNLTSVTYTIFPGFMSSPGSLFVVTPTVTTTYTIYCSGINGSNQMVTTNTVITVQLAGVTFSLQSPNNYTLGCATSSVGTIFIQNANSTPVSGAPVSYTILPPGFGGNVPFAGPLSTTSVYSVTIPGTYTVMVRDNTNNCTGIDMVVVSSNTVSPSIGSCTVSPSTINCYSPTAQIQVLPNGNNSYQWLPSNTSGSTVTVFSNTVLPTATVAANVTLVVTNSSNLCTADTAITIFQNMFKPNALISNGNLASCSPTMMLTNISTSGIPIGLFPTNMSVVGSQWMGPSPQTPASNSSTYVASTSGVYTMVALDLNNGCSKSGTFQVNLLPTATFTSSVSSAVVSFTGSSIGAGANTIYYWNFGDGVTSSIQNPTHTYNSSGAHLVTYKMTNSASCLDSISQTVTVSGIPCLANSGFSLVPTATPQVWNAIPNYPWNVTAAQWSWGDASTSNVLYTNHQYASAGLYNICLTVTVSCVGSSSTCTSYSVYRVTEAMQMVEIRVLAPELSTGINKASVATAQYWNLSPNPSSGNIKLSATQFLNSDTQLEILDVTGRVVMAQNISKSNLDVDLDLTELSAGIYHIVLSNNQYNEVQRLVLTK